MNGILGIDIGGTKMLLVYEHSGKIIESQMETGPDFSIQDLSNNLNDFIDKLPSKPQAIGIALPGLVECTDRLIISDVLPKLNNMETTALPVEIPVFFINDLSAALTGEMVNYNENHTVAVVMVGTGIGVGVWENGRRLEGAKGWAGEMGYMYLNATEQGVQTLDSLSSGAAILRETKLTSHELLHALANNDQAACAAIAKAAFYLGIGITNLIHMLNPHAVVIGGGASIYAGYFEEVVSTVEKYGIPEMVEICKLARPKDNKRIAALGAARFAQKNMDN